MFFGLIVALVTLYSEFHNVQGANERYYRTLVRLANNSLGNECEGAGSIWFQIGGSDEIYTEWFELSEINVLGTTYDLSQYLRNVASTPKTLKMVKFDSNMINIERVSVDLQNYTFIPNTRNLGVAVTQSNGNINGTACDSVVIDFVSQMHQDHFYQTNCPYIRLAANSSNIYNYQNNMQTFCANDSSIDCNVTNTFGLMNDNKNGSIGIEVASTMSSRLSESGLNSLKEPEAPVGLAARLASISNDETSDIDININVAAPTSVPIPAPTQSSLFKIDVNIEYDYI